MKHRSPLFVFGRCAFALQSADQHRLGCLSSLFLPLARAQAGSAGLLDPVRVVDVDDLADSLGAVPGQTEDARGVQLVYAIFSALMSNHSLCLYLSAATVISPAGELVLLAGLSGAGKTTLALAMAFAHGWKVVADDSTMIDTTFRRLIPLARPSSIRPAGARLLLETVGAGCEPLVFDHWYFNDGLIRAESDPAHYAAAVLLEGGESGVREADEGLSAGACGEALAGDVVEPLAADEIDQAELLRRLLPLSNALRLEGGLETLTAMIAGARCFCLRGGTLAERMAVLGGGGARRETSGEA